MISVSFPLALDYLFLWFLFYSFCGWTYESILVSVQERRPVNRGFLNGPLCPIYGSGAVLAVVLLGGLHGRPLAVFVVSAVGACALEYFTSWAMERLFHARWWDYSNFRFNLNGRICLLGALVFGVGGVVIVDVVQPQVAAVTAMIPLTVVHWLSLVLFVAVVADTIVTVTGIVDLEGSLDRFRETVAKYGDAMREKVGDAVSGMASGMSGVASGVASGVSGTVDHVSAYAGEVPGMVGDAVSGIAGVAGRTGERFGESLQSGREMSAEFMARVRQTAGSVFNRQQRRMIASFPKLRTSRDSRNNEALEQLREAFESRRGDGR
ncbi:putative ABC transporter permease [Bifidobacterium saguinibicoloris]|uniref:putative ABC transporter permease n=1 Tax=Bifidobacterium saguinibicoloris TaxID=2834433 RepID=UPI001F410B07|nr:putative ABC transporter permease [Bifidobacterium saguinibicoloris]